MHLLFIIFFRKIIILAKFIEHFVHNNLVENFFNKTKDVLCGWQAQFSMFKMIYIFKRQVFQPKDIGFHHDFWSHHSNIVKSEWSFHIIGRLKRCDLLSIFFFEFPDGQCFSYWFFDKHKPQVDEKSLAVQAITPIIELDVLEFKV